jgi:hypothetical protein
VGVILEDGMKLTFWAAILYKSLGIGSKEILALAGVYGTIAFTSNAIIFSRMILAGLLGIVFVEIYAAVMQREFQNTNNKIGKGFAILGIYLFVVTYCKFSQS